MADGIDGNTLLIIGMLLALAGLLFLELRFLRKRRARKEKETDLPDRAHNALLTTKAIRDTVARGGVRSAEAEEAIREADVAYRDRHYRVALDLADKGKALLRTAKLQHEKRGEVAKLDAIASKKSGTREDEVTEKERLMKELPKNYMSSKFSMGLAGDDIAAAKGQGQSTTEAEGLLSEAQAAFDREDYDAALAQAVRARRSLESPAVAPASDVVAEPPNAPSRTCTSCGAPVAADDTFCRKCGVKFVGPPTCPSCGTERAAGDAFCRKCGTHFS